MALQNRVTPAGDIVAVSSRGTLMGNRGKLHNEKKEIVSLSKIKGWVTCKLEFKSRKRILMSPDKYTELFFLDEATAFSAGHRPCAECRRARYNEFKEKWLEANDYLLDGQSAAIANIDKIIHQQRLNNKKKVTFQDELSNLPDGTMFLNQDSYYIIWKNEVYRWGFEGYMKSNLVIDNTSVDVLTPKSYVEMFIKGFVPEVHPSLA